MAAENPNFRSRPEQDEGKWKSLTLAFRNCCDHNSISVNDRKNAHFTEKLQSSMVKDSYATRSSSGLAALTRSNLIGEQPSRLRK